MNTERHDGSLTTIHSNTPRDALARLETMSLMGDVRLPEKSHQGTDRIGGKPDCADLAYERATERAAVTHITRDHRSNLRRIISNCLTFSSSKREGLSGPDGRACAAGSIPRVFFPSLLKNWRQPASIFRSGIM